MKTYNQVKKELTKDAEYWKFADHFGPGFPLAQRFIQKRIEQNLTQTEIAKRLNTTQTAISRFESGAANPTVGFLYRLAKALDLELRILVR